MMCSRLLALSLVYFSGSLLGQENSTTKTISLRNKLASTESPENFEQLKTKNLSAPEQSRSKSFNRRFRSPKFDAKHDYCTCNLKHEFCDLNCCCDEFCTEEDRNLFAYCEKIKRPNQKFDFCFNSAVIFLNNTAYQMERTSSGIFCIVYDNRKSVVVYPDLKPISSLSESRRIMANVLFSWTQRTSYQSTPSRSSSPQSQMASHYFFNEPILATSLSGRGTEIREKFSLPVGSVVSEGFCDSFSEVRYLHDSEHSCLLDIKDLVKECQSSSYLKPFIYFENIFITKQGKFVPDIKEMEKTSHFQGDFNDTLAVLYEEGPLDSPSHAALQLTNYSLSLQPPDCIHLNHCIPIILRFDSDFKVPHLIEKSEGHSSCVDVVSSVSYTFIYSPSEGIESAEIEFKYANLTAGKPFRQHFSVNFISSRDLTNKTENSIIFSGNPGYIFGKPVLFRTDEINGTEPSVYRLPFNLDGKGLCSKNRHTLEEIVFGKNLRGGCMLNISTLSLPFSSRNLCQSIQAEIIQLIDGINEEITHIATYGNPNISNSFDWIPIFLDNEAQALKSDLVSGFTADGRCPALVTGFSVEIFYTYIGNLEQPQAKIISAVKKYRKPQDIRMKCKSMICKKHHNFPLIELSFSVSFIFVDSSPQTLDPSPPVIDFQLPPDFFYPFSISNANHVHKKFFFFSLVRTLVSILIAIIV